MLVRAAIIGVTHAAKQHRAKKAGEENSWNENWIGTAPPPDPRRVKETELYAGDVTKLAVGALAKFAKADGIVTKQEVQAIEGAFLDLGLVGEARQEAIALFGEAKAGPLTYVDVLDLFVRFSKEHDQDRIILVVLLMRVAHADGGTLSYQSEHWLQNACKTLGCDYQQCLTYFHAAQEERAAQMRAEQQAQANRIKSACEILGCGPTDSDEHIKQRYRILVREFHPDTLAAKGLSAEFARFAEEKFKQIQAAYELLVDQRRQDGA